MLALALSYGTFASQAMAAAKQKKYTYETNFFTSGTPDGFIEMDASDVNLADFSGLVQKGENRYTFYKNDDTGEVIVQDALRPNDWKVYSLNSDYTEPTPEDTTPEDTTTEDTTMPSAAVFDAPYVMYSPSFANISSTGNAVSSMQNIAQNAYATNTANLTNSMNITGMDGSDLVNNMNVNTNAMNSNIGSSYNNSTNNITTDTYNNSINDYTTTLDSSRNVEVPSL